MKTKQQLEKMLTDARTAFAAQNPWRDPGNPRWAMLAGIVATLEWVLAVPEEQQTANVDWERLFRG